MATSVKTATRRKAANTGKTTRPGSAAQAKPPAGRSERQRPASASQPVPATEQLANLTEEEHAERLRAAARDQLAADVEAFLAQGGRIENIPRDHRADPPRKPQNNYGKGSI